MSQHGDDRTHFHQSNTAPDRTNKSVTSSCMDDESKRNHRPECSVATGEQPLGNDRTMRDRNKDVQQADRPWKNSRPERVWNRDEQRADRPWKNSRPEGVGKSDEQRHGNTAPKAHGSRNYGSQQYHRGRSNFEPRNRNFKDDTPTEKEQTMDQVSANTASSKASVKEIKKDLFDMPPDYALAHCVGSDFIMSSGVAVKFRKKYRSVPELLDQNKKPGQVAFIKHQSGQYIYYLVTKHVSTGKPKWEDFEKSVKEWRKLCVEHEVKNIAIPKIGCGRDHLDWTRVTELLGTEFANTGIELTVCIIDRETTPEKKWNLKLIHSLKPLALVDPRECALVFISSTDRNMSEEVNRLAETYGFLSDYQRQVLTIGTVYHFANKFKQANIFGLVVKECHKGPISFSLLAKCLLELKKMMKKLQLYFVGLEAFDDPCFDIVTRKMWTLIIDSFYTEHFEIHLCWPSNIKEKCWEDARS